MIARWPLLPHFNEVKEKINLMRQHEGGQVVMKLKLSRSFLNEKMSHRV